jgi:hypothetical protein
MQPVPAKDRPKLIAVAIAIIVALAFVIRNLMGLQTNAQPRVEEPAATAAPAGAAATANAAATAVDVTVADAPAGSEVFASGTAEGFAPRDPFRPLEPVEIAIGATGMPSGRAPGSPTPVLPPVRPAVATAPPARATAVRCPAPLPEESEAPQSALPPSRMGESVPPRLPEPAGDTRLVGTVRQEPTALAVFRGSEKAQYIRPQEMIARWRVVRIDDGQVSLRHRDVQQVVRVGEHLPTAP